MNITDKVKHRFFKKISEADNGCWIWKASKNPQGYGKLFVDGRLRVATHVSLEISGRPLAKGKFALHKCDNTSCVNPDHLFQGDAKSNIEDAMAKGRAKPGSRDHMLKMQKLATRAFGDRVNTAKLTPNQVREIRGSRISLSKLACIYGVNKTTIGRVKSGKSWGKLA